MKNCLKIAPSMLSADYANLAESVALCEDNSADLLHFDVMDGHFVPNITIGPLVVKALRKLTNLLLDCHLMIMDTDKYIPQFVEAGADWISVHFEVCNHLHRTLSIIKGYNKTTGLALNPATPIEFAFDAAEYVDFILLMSVNPGFGGQKLISSFYKRCEKLRNFLDKHGLENVEIQVDGGINTDNISKAADCGANIFVAGSALFDGDFKKNIANMRLALKNN